MNFSIMLWTGSMLAAIAGIMVAPSVLAQDIGALEKRVKALKKPAARRPPAVPRKP